MSLAEAYGPALQKLSDEGRVRDYALLHLPADVPPWTGTGLRLERGDRATLLAAGRVRSELLGLAAGPKFHLWRRVVAGDSISPVRKGTSDTTTFVSDAPGDLELAICQGEWGSTEGELATPVEAYAASSGGIEVVAVVWKDDPATGLEALAALATDGALAREEQHRLAHPVPRPTGWEYLWFLGESDTFARPAGETAIRADTRDDAAILRRPVDLDVVPGTCLAWRWKIDRLPSQKAEDELLCHDYLSIAAEFDCGRDITYFWSSSLPEGRVFACPIPTWTPRETHVVVRSGTAGLGSWASEERDLFEDHRRILGSEAGRLVAVWLIAVSVFQHGEGRAAFDGIELRSPQGSLAIV